MFPLYMQEGGREGGSDGGRAYLGGDTVDTADSHHERNLGLSGDIERTGSLGLSSQADLVVLQLMDGEGGREGGREGYEWMRAVHVCVPPCR